MSGRPWDDLQGRLRAGEMVRKWSVDKGYLAGEFMVDSVSPDRVVISGSSIQSKSVIISRAEFERVVRVWPEYSTGDLPRNRLRDMSFRSTYIVSLLHWLESGRDQVS